MHVVVVMQLGMLGLLERENAAVLNESLKSLAQVTVRAFEKALVDMGIRCPFFLTQNDGTLITYVCAMLLIGGSTFCSG